MSVIAVLAAAPAFAQIFVPITPSPLVPGAFGTEWKTELWVYNGAATEATITPSPAPVGTQFVIPPRSSLELTAFDPAAGGRGVVLDPGNAADLHLELQVREFSRGDLSGVSVATIPLAGFSSTPLQLLNVPATSEFRTTLRLYVRFAADAPAPLTLRVFDMEHDGVPLLERQVLVSAPRALPPTYIDSGIGAAVVTDLFLGLREVSHARIEVAGDGTELFHAFASVTDNETQHVLVITPT